MKIFRIGLFRTRTTCRESKGLVRLVLAKKQRSAYLHPTYKLYQALFMGKTMGIFKKYMMCASNFFLKFIYFAIQQYLSNFFIFLQCMSKYWLSERLKRLGQCRQVGSDKERSKGWVGSGNAKGHPALGWVVSIFRIGAWPEKICR